MARIDDGALPRCRAPGFSTSSLASSKATLCGQWPQNGSRAIFHERPAAGVLFEECRSSGEVLQCSHGL
jgi:hypothetical protein